MYQAGTCPYLLCGSLYFFKFPLRQVKFEFSYKFQDITFEQSDQFLQKVYLSRTFLPYFPKIGFTVFRYTLVMIDFRAMDHIPYRFLVFVYQHQNLIKIVGLGYKVSDAVLLGRYFVVGTTIGR